MEFFKIFNAFFKRKEKLPKIEFFTQEAKNINGVKYIWHREINISREKIFTPNILKTYFREEQMNLHCITYIHIYNVYFSILTMRNLRSDNYKIKRNLFLQSFFKKGINSANPILLERFFNNILNCNIDITTI